MKLHETSRERGFVLLEILLALTIFSISVTGIVFALQSSTKLVETVQREAWIQEQFKEVMAEALKSKQTREEFIKEKVITLREFGAEAIVQITPSELENQEGLILQSLFDMKITITWREDVEKKEAVLETYQYYPLYQN